MPHRPKHPSYPSTTRARQLRRDQTAPERILWNLLRGGRLASLKFRRQQPIGPYIVDFLCLEATLVVEVDGRSHDDQAEADRERESYLTTQQGLNVLRIANDDVLNDRENVILAILRAAGNQPT